MRGPGEDAFFWALEEASFEVPRGSTFGLVGPNGSGKSTTLKVIAGIYRPTRGSVQVRGRLSALLELGAGFHPELSGRENIALNASLLGLTPAEIVAATDEIIDFADLGEHIDAPVKVYSSGMYVRLGFAIAVAVRPDILVIDEVIAVGDEDFQRKCFDHMYSLRKSGATIVLVSHNLGVIENLCDDAVWIEGGRIRRRGWAREVVRKYIDSVNDVQSRVDETTGLDHHGFGEATINGLTFRGQGSDAVVSGEPFEAVLTFDSSTRLEDASIVLSFLHESGVRVAAPTSQDSGSLSIPPGPGQMCFSCGSLILMPGRYVVSAAILQPGHLVDNVTDQFELVVQPSQGTGSGLVRMDGRWRFSEG